MAKFRCTRYEKGAPRKGDYYSGCAVEILVMVRTPDGKSPACVAYLEMEEEGLLMLPADLGVGKTLDVEIRDA